MQAHVRRFRYFGPILLIFIGQAGYSAQSSLTLPKGPVPNFKWIDPNGGSLPIAWPFKGEWIWARISSSETFLRPTYRVYVNVPAKIRIEKFEAKNGRMTLVQNAEDSPFTGTAQQLVMIETVSPSTSATLWWSDTADDAQVHEMSLLVQFPVAQASSWLDDACLKEGIGLKPLAAGYTHLYLGATCHRSGDRLLVRLLWSDDLREESSSLPKSSSPSRNSLVFEFSPDSDPLRKQGEQAEPKSLGKLDLAGVTSEESPEKKSIYSYQVLWTPKSPPQRLALSASAGLSYISYSEDPQGISVSELGVTGKFLASHSLNSHTDISGSVFLTLVPLGLGSTPAGLSPLRVYGINGRVGYELTPDQHPLGHFNLKLSGGWYTWGMLVPGASYGANFLMGPQLLVSASGQVSGSGKPWGAYLKLAPISDQSFSASLKNREIAVGGNYQLSPPQAQHPWTLTADLAQMSVDFSEATNRIRMLSFSWGASYGF